MKKSSLKKIAIGTMATVLLSVAAVPAFAGQVGSTKIIAGNNASVYTPTGDGTQGYMKCVNYTANSPIEFKLKQKYGGFWYTDRNVTYSTANEGKVTGSSFQTNHTWEASAFTSKTYAHGSVALLVD